MQIRKNFYPRTPQDTGVTTFVAVMIPIAYWFELFLVLPTFHEVGSSMHVFHLIMGTFIFFNVTTNFVTVVVSDPSTAGIMLPSTVEKNWRFCLSCEATAPPRSWHCKTCKTCVLKRDHHCVFTSNCIGHSNLRYFLMFVFYMFIGTCYATYFNVRLIWSLPEFFTYMTIFKVFFPMAMFFIEMTPHQLYLLLTILVMFGSVYSGVVLFMHTKLMCKGMITHEENENITMYDMGLIGNIKDVFGHRWYLVWLSPFIRSDLPSDGMYWETSKLK